MRKVGGDGVGRLEGGGEYGEDFAEGEGRRWGEGVGRSACVDLAKKRE